MTLSKPLKTYSLGNKKSSKNETDQKTKSLTLPREKTKTSINAKRESNQQKEREENNGSQLSDASTVDLEMENNMKRKQIIFTTDFSRINLNKRINEVKYASLPTTNKKKKKEGLSLRTPKVKKVIFRNLKINKINVNNYNFKPSYISAVKTGSDLKYLYIFDILKEEIVNNINDFDKKTKDEYYMDGLLKCCFMLLNKISNNDNEKLFYNQYGGSCVYIPVDTYQNSFLKFQFVFDNKHDFNIHSSEIPDSWLYKEDKIEDNELKPLFKLEERVLFNELLKKSNQIVDNILYFSIYNLVEYKKNNPNISGRIIINNDDQLKLIKENTRKFLKDILVSDTLKFVSDGNLNMGKFTGIREYSRKLNMAGIIQNSQIDKIVSEYNSWKSIKDDIKNFVKENRFYTYEDIFDSYPITSDVVLSEIQKLNPNEINKYAYITNLIFNDVSFASDPNVSSLDRYSESFKAYTPNLRKMFSNVYYYDERKKTIETAIIFNNSTIIENNIPIMISKLIYLKLDPTLTTTLNLSNQTQIYKLESQKKPDNYFAINLTNMRNSYSDNKTLNTIKNIVSIIKTLNEKNTIQEMITLLNLRGNPPNLDGRTYNLLFLIYISKFISLTEDRNHNNRTLISPSNKIEIAHCFFDLKRAGDMGKILFTYFYNCLKNIPSFMITTDPCYIGNDKLALLNSIVRQGNSVIYPDATNYAFSVYNINNKNFTFLTLMGLLNMYLIPKFIDNDYDIFTEINSRLTEEKTTPIFYNFTQRNLSFIEGLKILNYIFRNVDHEKIFFKYDGKIRTHKEIIINLYKNVENELKKSNLIDFPFTNLSDLRDNIQQICDNYQLTNDIVTNPELLQHFNNFLRPINQTMPVTNLQKNNLYHYVTKFKTNYELFNQTHAPVINGLIKEREELMFVNGHLNLAGSHLINGIQSKIEYLKIIRYFSMLYSISIIYTTDVQSLNINNYIKTIIFTYLDHVKQNIIKNLTNEKVIEYYLTDVIFYRINFDFVLNTHTPILKELFKTIVRQFLLKISKLIESIIDAIKNKILQSSTNLLSDTEILRGLLININKFLKIIEVFLFIDINDQNIIMINEDNIHHCMEKLKYYIYDLLTIKSRNAHADRFKLTYKDLKMDKTNRLLQSLITPIDQTQFDDVNIGNKCKTLTNSLFKNLNNLNYVIVFNLLYKELNKYDEIEILGEKLVSIVTPELSNLIKQIKKIYKYSYLEVHDEVTLLNKFNLFIDEIISLIQLKAEHTIRSFESNTQLSIVTGRQRRILAITESKKKFFKQTTEELLHDIQTNIRPNFLMMEKAIHEDTKSFPYTTNVINDIRYFDSILYNAETSEYSENKDQLSDVRKMINEDDISVEDMSTVVLPLLNNLNQTSIDQLKSHGNLEIQKLAKVYEFFINDI